MIDWNKPIETMEGIPARLICSDRKSTSGYSHVMLADTGDVESYLFARKDGTSDCNPSVRNKPERIERTYWVNVYRDDETIYTSKSRADGAQRSDNSRLACVEVKISCNVGDGL